ncbi:NfeD family protein [Methylobacterium sp. WL30]|uniref:NfeD family protein n=1 Tax=unclassified Methylobacterium TaxID=2615210 RepID=UPI0011C70C2B|nr:MULTISPECIES: NfeD family protein [unclassified Methylobacterium]TXM89978.1 NfeD family protein [Methylobacterium sp. WL116]MCJ2037522.1 NfeD family protein [Methylobacterium sp. J-059]TXN25236.1 NfeD family protein [Methylobacterium sp. WL93]TXN44601.1 NfeD family protein [Methylobacterium sp. WL119]TXN63457.1 NfeD family protein [Methylobacterium sp. WL30]
MLANAFADLGPAWAWILAGLALAGLELVAPGIFLIWLGLAGLATGLVAALVPLPWQAQLLLFSGLAVAAVLIARRLGRDHVPTLNRADRGLVGREGLLAEPIQDGAGRIRFDDTLWRVTGPDLPAGARVRVTGIDGTVLVVTGA